MTVIVRLSDFHQEKLFLMYYEKFQIYYRNIFATYAY